jgi:hypothetical protein
VVEGVGRGRGPQRVRTKPLELKSGQGTPPASVGHEFPLRAEGVPEPRARSDLLGALSLIFCR